MTIRRDIITSVIVSLLLGATLIGMGWLKLPKASSRASWPVEGVYSGYFVSGLETSTFVPAGSNERWHLTGRAAQRVDLRSGRPMYVEVRATLSTLGSYGHLGQYVRELDASDVISMRHMLPCESADALC